MDQPDIAAQLGYERRPTHISSGHTFSHSVCDCMVHPLLDYLSCVNEQRSHIMVLAGAYIQVHALYSVHVCHWHRMTV